MIFDLDGVLTDTVEFHYQSWQRLAGELGLPFDREANEALRGRTRDDALRLFLDGRSVAEDRDSLLARKNSYFLERIERLGPEHLAPGVGRLLEEARELGVRLGLASSSRNARLVCAKLGILDRFEVVVDGCSGLRPKPAPDSFIWVAGGLGIEPACCTVIEDAQAGVDAALAGGFFVVGLGPPERVGRAQLVLPSLERAELAELVPGLPAVQQPERQQ